VITEKGHGGRASAGLREKWVRLEIRPDEDTYEDSGFPSDEFVLLEEVWAAKEDLAGRERVALTLKEATFDTRWQVPYLAEIDPEQVDVPKRVRVVYYGRVYDVAFASRVGDTLIELLTLAGARVDA